MAPDDPPDKVGTEPPEPEIHSFIVKIVLDEPAQEAGLSGWHGYVTHVPGGERRYLKELDEIVVFIVSCLAGIGVRLNHQRRAPPALGRLAALFTRGGSKARRG